MKNGRDRIRSEPTHTYNACKPGTGTGLLALLAVEAGAGQVYACETNPVLAKMAQAIVAAAHGARAEETIVVLNKSSHELRIGEGTCSQHGACTMPSTAITHASHHVHLSLSQRSQICRLESISS